MNDTMDRLRKLKSASDLRKDTSKDQNRALMPTVTEFIDAVRAEFGECKVSYVSEGGITKGVKWPDAVPVSEIYVPKEKK